MRGESNGHDVRRDARPLRENERLGREVRDTELRRDDCAAPCFSRCSSAPASGQRMQRHAATSVAITSVILRVQDHDRGAVASNRKGQYKQHEHALRERRANLALAAGDPTASRAVGSSVRGHQVLVETPPATPATPHSRRMCRSGVAADRSAKNS